MAVAKLAEEDIFNVARKIDSSEARAAYVHQVCGDDDALRGRIEGLLQIHEQEQSFLQPPSAALTSPEAPAETPGTVIGPYKLLQQIGEGGMGVVWMAEQTQPVQRKVALKVIKPGMDSRQVVARFEAERQALALMDHVNIARVFDGGTTDTGRPYFVMELVHGVPITKYCDDNHLTPRERLELFVPVCQAIQHAHQKGIIHRDIKPSNVMVTLYDGKPVPKVIDFGVAKATEQKLTERTLFTQYGTMVGTLEYMSPEQAEMSALGVDTRSDIYSLGVLLYELLTGSTPLTHKRMKEAAYAEILRMIKEEEPPKPSTRLSESKDTLPVISAQRQTEPAKLTKLVRGELDWIVMKALEKDRERRYTSASDLALDVRRFLADEAVLACPPSAVYRFKKFVRRRKRTMTAAGFVFLACVLGILGITWQWLQAEAARQHADQQKAIAEQKTLDLRHRLYDTDLHQAFRLWERGDLEGLDRLLAEHGPQVGRPDFRGFEWHYLYQASHARPDLVETFRDHTGDVYVALYSPDGKLLASAGKDRTVRLRDLANGTTRVLGQHDNDVNFLLFSPQGEWLASAGDDRVVRLWEVASGRLMRTFETPHPVGAVGFSPDGKTLSAGGGDGVIRQWEIATEHALDHLEEHQAYIHFLHHAADGRSLVSCDKSGRIIVWDLNTRRPRFTLQEKGQPVFSVCFSPDGHWIASGCEDGIMRLWRVADGTLVHSFGRHGVPVRCLLFSPDSARLAECNPNGMVRLWNVARGRLQSQFRAHPARVWTAGFSPDGQSLVTASADHTVKLWRLPKRDRNQFLPCAARWLTCLSFADDSQSLAFATNNGAIGLWNRNLACLKILSPDGDGDLARSAFLADGRLAVSGHLGAVRMLVPGAKQFTELLPPRAKPADRDEAQWANQQRVCDLAVSRDGKYLAAGYFDGTVQVRDLQTGSTWRDDADTFGARLALAPDGRSLMVARSNEVRFWSFAEKSWAGPPRTLPPGITAVAIAPDERTLALGYLNDIIRLVDGNDGKILAELIGHEKGVTSLDFAPDGRTLASSSHDGTVRLWNPRTQQEITVLDRFAGPIHAVRFSPDGATLAAAGDITPRDAGLAVWMLDSQENRKPKKD